jgi:hypothetical protein
MSAVSRQVDTQHDDEMIHKFWPERCLISRLPLQIIKIRENHTYITYLISLNLAASHPVLGRYTRLSELSNQYLRLELKPHSTGPDKP